MPIFKTNTNEAVILSIPEVKEQANKSSYNCFMNIIDCLELQPKNSDFTTTVINIRLAEAGKRRGKYQLCAHILTLLDKNNLVEEKFSVNDSKFRSWLQKNIIKGYEYNMTINPKIDPGYKLDGNDIDSYVRFFLNFVREHHGESYNSSKKGWLTIHEEFTNLISPLILEEISYSILLERGYSEHELSSPENILHFSFLQKELAINYNLIPDKAWNRDQPIDDLISAIKENGYLIVGGCFGSHIYKNDLTAKVVDGLEVYTWKKGDFDSSKLKKQIAIAHEVIIIGASKKGYAEQGQDFVYMIDPDEDKNSYPIYMISYNSFRERVGTTQGLADVKDPKSHTFFYSSPTLKPAASIGNANTFSDTPFFSYKKMAVVAGLGVGIAVTTLLYKNL